MSSPLASSPLAAPLSLLDDPQEWSAFSQSLANRPHVWQSSVVFEGMHCAACAINIEDALRTVPGVASVQVSAASHRGLIEWTDAACRRANSCGAGVWPGCA